MYEKTGLEMKHLAFLEDGSKILKSDEFGSGGSVSFGPPKPGCGENTDFYDFAASL